MASPRPGGVETIAEPIDRLVICAYAPYDSYQGDVPVRVGIGLAGQEAVDLVDAIEAAPVDNSAPEACNDDAGLAYVLLVGAGDVMSRVLYAETFGCRLVGEITPGVADENRLQLRRSDRALEIRLLDAVGRVAAGAFVDWADLALDLGYADPAHFIRDFKRLVGRSPAEYARSLGGEPATPRLVTTAAARPAGSRNR